VTTPAVETEPGTVAGSVPYPWPYDGHLSASRTAVVVAGAHAAAAGPEAGGAEAAAHAPGLLALLAAARAVGAECIFVRHGRRGPLREPGRGPLPEIGSPGWALAGGLARPEEPVVDSRGIDGFFGSDLDRLLREREVTHLVLAGMGLETFVHSTMRTANDLGYECVLALGAAVPDDPALTEAAALMITMSGGIFGAIAEAEAVASALLFSRARKP
jgi:biuret amidohydrolase